MKNLYYSVCFALVYSMQVSTAQPLQNEWNNNSSAQFTMDTVDDYGFEWPAWIFSHWVWEDEGNRESSLQLIDSYLAHGIPVGAAIIDSPWETGYNTFVYDTTLFPDPQSMVDYYHSKNVKLLMWITGVINTDVQPLYDSVAALGYFMKANASDTVPAIIEWWKGDGSLIDLYNPDAVAWWKGMMDNVLDLGIDGWKCDGTDYYALGARYSPYLGANVSRLNYSHAYYQLFHDYTRERLGNKRVNMARPIDNYGQFDLGGDFVAFQPKEISWAAWVGDQDATWDGMEKALNNMYWSDQYGYLSFGSDIAGYREDDNAPDSVGREKELYIRWAQLGALSPLMENGSVGPWKFDDETTNIYRRFAKIHTSLMPYLMTESETYFANGDPLMQFFNKNDYSFMLGPDIFVAPVLGAGGIVNVHFPSGNNWVYLFDSTVVKTGGSSEAINFPLSEFPVYVREGSAYATSINDPGLISSVAENVTEINFSVYPNPASSQLTLLSMLNGQWSVVNIYNTTGQLVLHSTFDIGYSTLDISSLSSGIYYLHLQGNDGAGVKKFEVVK